MQEMDRTRQQHEELNDLELEAQQQAEYLLQKAKEQRNEQEDEIKHLNEVSARVCILCPRQCFSQLQML